jgi:hypothetical protein
VGGSCVKVARGLSANTISLLKVWRLVLGLDKCEPRGDTTLSGVSLGEDATSECVRTSPERWPVEEGEREGEVKKVGDLDLERDLQTGLDIVRVKLEPKPVKR